MTVLTFCIFSGPTGIRTMDRYTFLLAAHSFHLLSGFSYSSLTGIYIEHIYFFLFLEIKKFSFNSVTSVFP
jgi:hypothetical protein